jgi:hypothetical protein
VRNGLILNSTISPTSGPCNASDQIDQPYYDVFSSQANGTLITGVTDIIVPANTAAYYFWIDIATNAICYGATPTSPDHGAAYSGFPTVNSNSVLIGWVDTNTLASQARALIRQVQTTDVLAAGGGSSGPTVFTVNLVSTVPDLYPGYFIAQNTSSGGALTRIAMPYKLHQSITAEKIYGTTFNYTYTSAYQRTTTSGGYTQYDRITPPYAQNTTGSPVGDKILADNVGYAVTGIVSIADTISGTPGAQITWQDRNNDGRAWGATANGLA